MDIHTFLHVWRTLSDLCPTWDKKRRREEPGESLLLTRVTGVTSTTAWNWLYEYWGNYSQEWNMEHAIPHMDGQCAKTWWKASQKPTVFCCSQRWGLNTSVRPGERRTCHGPGVRRLYMQMCLPPAMSAGEINQTQEGEKPAEGKCRDRGLSYRVSKKTKKKKKLTSLD